MRKESAYKLPFRVPLPHRPGRPQGSKKGKKGYSRTINKKELRQSIERQGREC